MFLDCIKAFLVGGVICSLGQLLLDRTGLTPARILSGCVILGVLLSAVGFYEPFREWAGAGASVPLLGFGHTLAEGTRKAVAKDGALGIFTGGMTAAAGGVSAAVVFAFLTALIFRPKEKD